MEKGCLLSPPQGCFQLGSKLHRKYMPKSCRIWNKYVSPRIWGWPAFSSPFWHILGPLLYPPKAKMHYRSLICRWGDGIPGLEKGCCLTGTPPPRVTGCSSTWVTPCLVLLWETTSMRSPMWVTPPKMKISRKPLKRTPLEDPVAKLTKHTNPPTRHPKTTHQVAPLLREHCADPTWGGQPCLKTQKIANCGSVHHTLLTLGSRWTILCAEVELWKWTIHTQPAALHTRAPHFLLKETGRMP